MRRVLYPSISGSLFLLLIIGIGCGGHIFRVSNDGKGIPFFTLEVVERTTAIYEQRYFELRLDMEWISAKASSIPESPFKNTSIRYASDAECAALVESLFVRHKQPQDAYDNVKDLLQSGKTICKPCRISPSAPDLIPLEKIRGCNPSLMLVSVTREQRSQPSSDVKYINVRKVASGSSQGTITLNKEGTLASATATITDSTLETVLKSLPVADAVSHGLKLSDTITLSIAGKLDTGRVAKSAILTIRPIARRYVLWIDTVLTEEELKQQKKCNKRDDKVRRRRAASDEVESAATEKEEEERYFVPDGSTVGVCFKVIEGTGDQKKAEEKKEEPALKFKGEVTVPKKVPEKDKP